MNILELKNVKKDYRLGETVVHALRGVDLIIERGEFAAILGASGSGKTTLLNLAGVIDDPTEGEVIVSGLGVSGLSDNRKTDLRNRTIGYIFQAFNLISVLTAIENVMLSLQVSGGALSEIQKEARMRLEEVGIAEFMHHRPDKLSGGQRQRVAIARALITRPQMIIADEPTANLDHKTAKSIITLMKEMNEREGVTFLFSTHDQRLIDTVGRVIRLEDGRIVEGVPA